MGLQLNIDEKDKFQLPDAAALAEQKQAPPDNAALFQRIEQVVAVLGAFNAKRAEGTPALITLPHPLSS